MTRKGLLVAAVAFLTLLVGAGIAFAQLSGQTSPSSDSGKASQVLAALDSSRVVSLDSSNGTVAVTGVATKDQGDVTRTLWYEGVAGTALAYSDEAKSVNRTVMDSSESKLDATEDAVADASSASDPFASTQFSSQAVQDQVNNQAARLGMKVVEVDYIDLYGGAAEVVVQPSDLDGTLSSASSTLAQLLGPVAQNYRPYLVTVVDKSGAPQLIVGFVPGLGGAGQGIAWQAPGVHSDAIFGTPANLPTG